MLPRLARLHWMASAAPVPLAAPEIHALCNGYTAEAAHVQPAGGDQASGNTSYLTYPR